MIGNSTYSDEDVFSIKGSKRTPHVVFIRNGQLSITGISIPEDGSSFYESIFRWLQHHPKTHKTKAILRIELGYINDISMKYLMHIIKQLDITCNQFHVEWRYEESDDDIRELGEILASTSKASFKFCSFQ